MNSPADLFVRYLDQRARLGQTEVVLDPELISSLRGQSVSAEDESVTQPAEALPSPGSSGAVTRRASDPLPVLSIATLEDLSQMAMGCVACRLAASRTNVVFAEGNANADLVVVGEAPGADEDRTGRPFVGRAGRLLDSLLASVGFPRESVYICNVLKCRPPGNRNPLPDEVVSCSPFLTRQIQLVKPKAILAVGTFPAQTLLATDEPIGRLRGKVHRYDGIPLIPTYHPAALLRNPGWIRPVWEDLQRLRTAIDP